MSAHTFSSSERTNPSSRAPPPATREAILLRPFSPNSNDTTKPINSQSPVRRKPLPLSAFSPNSKTSPTNQEKSPPRLGQVIQGTTVRQLAGDPVSQEGLGNEFSHPHGSTRKASRRREVTKSRINGVLPLIPQEELPRPLRRVNTQQSQPDGDAQNTQIGEEAMAFGFGSRPPPVRTNSASSTKSQGNADQKRSQTPAGKFTSFFSRKPMASPSAESSVTDISDHEKSPLPSPYPASPHSSSRSGKAYSSPKNGSRRSNWQSSQDSITSEGRIYPHQNEIRDLTRRFSVLESELKDITTELAHSIKREMDLEDMVERLQLDAPSAAIQADRTSDYFSDSGTSSIRPLTSDINPKEEIEKIRREADQQRAQLKIQMTQKWQTEVTTRRTLESKLQALEHKLSQSQQANNESSDLSLRKKELEVTLEDAKRRLREEKTTKENFEDLLTALRDDLQRHKNERDNLRDEVVPQLRSRIEGLEASLSDAQKSPYDAARMQQELQSLRDENDAFRSARAMNMQFDSIAEEVDPTSPSKGGLLSRSGTVGAGRGAFRNLLGRSNSLSRSNSTTNRSQPESAQSLADQLKAIEQQRDALHATVKHLLLRQQHQSKSFGKQIRVTEAERDRANLITSAKKGGFEKEVRTLRSEINLLRKRADDALEQKWQCEKGLAGLKMDLDRSKQETESLHKLLQARDTSAPEAWSSGLEQALKQLQQQREIVTHRESLGFIESEQYLADQLESSAGRAEALAAQVKQQLQANSALRARLRDAIEKGERNQHASADQINELQSKLRQLEDLITSAQMQTENAVMRHEEEVRVIRASTNVQLLRPKSGIKNANLFSTSPITPLSPMFNNPKKSPRLDKTSSGPGMALNQALKTEFLEVKVAELEKALSDAEQEMQEVVSRMNTAQIGVAELEAERDEMHRQTRKLEAEIASERIKVQNLIKDS